jgi:hypothetical protein
MPFFLLNLAEPQAKLAKFEDAWRSMTEAMSAMEATKEVWCEAEANRIGGEIALLLPERQVSKAQAYFERALSVARH